MDISGTKVERYVFNKRTKYEFFKICILNMSKRHAVQSVYIGFSISNYDSSYIHIYYNNSEIYNVPIINNLIDFSSIDAGKNFRYAYHVYDPRYNK